MPKGDTERKHTDEFNVSVVDMWNKGFSAGYIGDRMGVSRNAIIGVVRRIKAKGTEIRHGEIITRKPKDRTKKPKPSMPKLPETHLAPTIEVAIQQTKVEIQKAFGRWVSLNDTKRGCCRYTKDGKTYCNAEGFPWCDEHHDMLTKKKGENK